MEVLQYIAIEKWKSGEKTGIQSVTYQYDETAETTHLDTYPSVGEDRDRLRDSLLAEARSNDASFIEFDIKQYRRYLNKKAELAKEPVPFEDYIPSNWEDYPIAMLPTLQHQLYALDIKLRKQDKKGK